MALYKCKYCWFVKEAEDKNIVTCPNCIEEMDLIGVKDNYCKVNKKGILIHG